jgi:ubiquinone/menaquinone biosynthesis C-methylase UbiE
MKTSFKAPYMQGLSKYLNNLDAKNFKNDFKRIVHPYKSNQYIANLNYLKKKSLDILDIGCGIGTLMPFYDFINFNSCLMTDINSNYLKLCKKFAKEANLKKKYSYKKINIFKINTNQKYDLVVCAGMINYFEKKLQTKALERISKLSKKYIAIEIIHEKSFFNRIFKIFDNYFFKKIFFLIYSFLYIFLIIFKSLIRKKDYLFFLKCSILAKDLSTNHPQAKNSFPKYFYINTLKKNNFNLIKEFSYHSLTTMFFEKK